MWSLGQPLKRRVLFATLLYAAWATICAQDVACGSLDQSHLLPHVQTAHRRFADHAQALATGSDGQSPPSHEAVDDDRLSKYLPSESRSLAEELRAAREAERERTGSRHADVGDRTVARLSDPETMRVDQVAARQQQREPRSGPSGKRSTSGLRRGISAVRRAGRKASAQVQHYFDHDDEGDDEAYEEEDEGDNLWTVDGLPTRRRRRHTTSARSSASGIGSLVAKAFWGSISVAQWSSKNIVWTPMTYIGAAVQWSAHSSWRTTRWTGERALIAPARTATAPLIYLIDGLLFIFVWVPAGAIRAVVRELYPLYVFLGAALAIGTAMGILAAILLYIGSFLFDDQSQLANSLYERGEKLPREMERQLQQAYNPNASGRKKKSGRSSDKRGSIIEQAIRESLLRGDKSEASGEPGGWQGMPAPDSDEEDDYFGTNVPKSSTGKGKAPAPLAGRGSVPSTNTTPAATPGHARPLPVGATSQGGWSSRSDSNSSTPLASPVFTRPSVPSSPYAYASGRSPLVTPSPASRVGPDAIRSHHSRQRRGVQMPVS